MSADVHRLIRRVRRRMIWSEQLKRIQFGLLLATLAAAAISLVFILLGRSTLLPTIAVPIGGLLFGVGWASSINVTSLQAAARIDERFGLKNLVATAWQIQNAPSPSIHDGGWRQTISELADARCRSLNSSEMGIRLLNRPAWSIVALSSTLTLILGLWSPNGQAASSAAITSVPQFTTPISLSTNNGNRVPNSATHSPIQRDRPPGDGTIDESTNHHGSAGLPSTEGNQTASNSTRDMASGATASSDPDGGAMGFGKSSISIPKLNEIPADVKSSGLSEHGAPAGGGNGVADGQTAAEINGPGGIDSNAINAPVWHSTGVPSAQDNSAPSKSIQTRRFAPAFDDLIRDYFKRP